jgi:hypothetical protein
MHNWNRHIKKIAEFPHWFPDLWSEVCYYDTDLNFFFFFSYEKNQRTGGQNRSCQRTQVKVGSGRWWGKKVNIVQKLCTHVCK